MNSQNFSPGGENEDLYSLNMENFPSDFRLDLFENMPLVENPDTTTFHQVMAQESSTGTLPPIDDYLGPHNFQMFIKPNEREHTSWTYSTDASMLFIDIGKTALINFRVGHPSEGLFIRALLAYQDSNERKVAVVRCSRHQFQDDRGDRAHEGNICNCAMYNQAGHVVRTSRTDAIYMYNPETERHSVCVNVGAPPPGSTDITVPYSFSCMSTCLGGINRRPLYLIFTLENLNGQVLGRAKVSVKVCKCPKRDRQRKEAELGAPPGKKMKPVKVKYELVEASKEPQAGPCPNCGQQNLELHRQIQELKGLLLAHIQQCEGKK